MELYLIAVLHTKRGRVGCYVPHFFVIPPVVRGQFARTTFNINPNGRKGAFKVYIKFLSQHKVLSLLRQVFLRVHRSFIINKAKINHVEGNRVFINKTEIPIGQNYKEAFLRELGFGE